MSPMANRDSRKQMPRSQGNPPSQEIMNDKPTATFPTQSDPILRGSPEKQTQLNDGNDPARQLKAEASRELESLKQSAAAQTREATAKLKVEAQHLLEEAQDVGSNMLSTQKSALVNKMHQYQEAVQAAAETLRGENENILAGPAESAAHYLGRVCNYLDNHDPKELLHEMEGIARRRPELIFGGLFVAGFAVSRFLKASRSSPRTEAIRASRGGRRPTGQAIPRDPGPSTVRAEEPLAATGSPYPYATPSTLETNLPSYEP
jgi:hypothetical protein